MTPNDGRDRGTSGPGRDPEETGGPRGTGRSGGADESGTGVNIGSVESGSFAIGSHATVGNSYAGTAPTEAGPARLLHAIRELRSDLARLTATEPVARLDAELADAEAELDRTGGVSAATLLRLRVVASDADTSMPFLASVVLFQQVIATLDVVARPEPDLNPVRPPQEHRPGQPSPAQHSPPWGTPAGHTPPGPSTGSDDDEWPEP